MNRSAFLLGILVWGLISCSKSNQGSPSILVTDNIDTSKSAVKYRGAFASAPGERVNGMALILFEMAHTRLHWKTSMLEMALIFTFIFQNNCNQQLL